MMQLPDAIKTLIVRDFGNFYPEFIFAFPSTFGELKKKKYAELIVIHRLIRRALRYDIYTALLFANYFNIMNSDMTCCKDYVVVKKILVLKKIEVSTILKRLCVTGRFDILRCIDINKYFNIRRECLIECIKHRNIDCAMLFIDAFDDKIVVKKMDMRGKASGNLDDFKKFYKITNYDLTSLITSDRNDLCEWLWYNFGIFKLSTFPTEKFAKDCDRQQLWFRYYCSINDTTNAIKIFKNGYISDYENMSGIFKNATNFQIEWIFSVIRPTRMYRIFKELIKLDRWSIIENVMEHKMLPREVFIHGSDDMIDYIIKYSSHSHKMLVIAALNANSRRAIKKLGLKWRQKKITKYILKKYRRGLGLFITNIDYVLGFYNFNFAKKDNVIINAQTYNYPQ